MAERGEVDVAVDYNCGCGFKTKDPDEALMHVKKEKHVMTVLGTLKPDGRR